MDLEAVNRALAATVQKQEAELKAADVEIERLRQNIRAEALDMLHGTPCAEIRWQQERETLVAENERLAQDYNTARDAHDALLLENERLRAALKECLGWHDYADDMHKPIEVRAAYMRARAALAQPAAPGGDA